LRYLATASWYPDGRVGELFLANGKSNSRADINARDSGIVLSIAVQHSVDPETIRRALCRDSQGRACGPLRVALDPLAGLDDATGRRARQHVGVDWSRILGQRFNGSTAHFQDERGAAPARRERTMSGARVAGGEKHQPYGIFDRGHAFEHWCTTYLAAGLARAGGRLLYAGVKQRRLMLPDLRLAGTPDGLIEWPDQSETVLEVNSHGTAQNYDNCPSEMHVRQTELNIELFHEVTAHRPEDGIIIYGLAEDYGRLTLHCVERRPSVFVEILGKATAAFDAETAMAVTAEGVVTKQCVICPYRSRCAAAQMHAIPAAGTGGFDKATLHSIDRLIAVRARAVEAVRQCAPAPKQKPKSLRR
jgi:hypothetical protein